MKKLLIATMSLGLFSGIIMFGGCSKERVDADMPREKVEVVMYGGLSNVNGDKAKAQIIPNNGLPDEQLVVGIVTVNYRTADPLNVQPDLEAWKGTTVDVTRGYFGGPGLNATNITNGEIQYTNEDGTAIQKVFYDETGEHYFVRVYYPYEGSEFMQTDNGAAIVFSDMNGSKDILCSNLGWGNMDQKEIATDAENGVIVFSHMLSLFRIKVVAENEKAIEQYGRIDKVVMFAQPSSVIIDMMSQTIRPYSTETTNYDAVDFVPLNNLKTSAQEAGYIMAVPAQKFMIAAKSSERLWLGTDLDFTTTELPYNMSVPGKIYNVTLKFMESYQVHLEVEEADEWWMDSEFD